MVANDYRLVAIFFIAKINKQKSTLISQSAFVVIHSEITLWWEEMDSNHRSRKTTDLQSVAFGRSAIFPNGAGGRNRTNNRLITSQMLYH